MADHMADHMADQLTQDTGEVTTSPGALHSLGSQASNNHTNSEELEHLEALYQKEQQGRGRMQEMYPRDRHRLRAYGATLAGGFTILPLVALVLTVTFYLAVSNIPSWVSLVVGLLTTLVAWLIIALPLQFMTSRDKVNTRSYGLLASRLSLLESRLYILQTTPHKPFELYQLIALEEAYNNFLFVDAMLYESTSRLPWVLGIGYTVAWEKLHRAEEALLEVEPIEIVAREAYHDRMAIANSNMSNCNDLLDKLHRAVKTLDPGMESVVESSSSSADVVEEVHEVGGSVHKVQTQLTTVGQDVQKIEQDIQKIGQYLQVLVQTSEHAKKPTGKDGDSESDSSDGDSDAKNKVANARGTIREIRHTLNEYRDLLWEGIIRSRNRLMGGVFITSLATYVLLGVAILAALPLGTGPQDERSALLAASAYYIVGAIAGLFGTIYRLSTAKADGATRTDVDDYGLTMARLISTPLLSGLAGIGGAIIYNTLVIQVASSASFTLSAIFSLNRLDYLIAAAAFGFAPSLLFQGLQQRSNNDVSALQSSKASGQSSTANKN